MGATINETMAVIERRGWRHGEITTAREVRAVTAWIRDAYRDFSGGFPSSVEVGITFVFNRQGALKRVEFSERRISL